MSATLPGELARPFEARDRGPSAGSAVRRELARAVGDLLLLPPRTLGYLLARGALRAELEGLLARPAEVVGEHPIGPLPARPLSVFVSCAEASGEIHAVSLVRALKQELARANAPPARFSGLGGARLAAEGVELLGGPVERSRMGLDGIASGLPYYLELLRACAAHWRAGGTDVFVPVDSPALHVPMGRIARRYRVPTVHFVTPQHWGWAPWRTAAYRDAVDRALSILPFEPAWFASRGVPVVHVGHPLLDALAEIPATRPAEDARDLVLLPGSRERVIERNLPWMLARARELREGAGDVPVVVVQEDRALAGRLERLVAAAGAGGFARVEVGALHATLARARAALSVSGTVLLDLLHHRLPAVVVYRLATRREAWMSRHLLTVPWFSSVNLLAGREVYPEHCFAGEGPRAAIAADLERAWSDAEWRRGCQAGLDLAHHRLGPPGAAARAAREVLTLVAGGGGGG